VKAFSPAVLPKTARSIGFGLDKLLFAPVLATSDPMGPVMFDPLPDVDCSTPIGAVSMEVAVAGDSASNSAVGRAREKLLV
jgi:hypothetical protein